MVAHACNSSYSGVEIRKIEVLDGDQLGQKVSDTPSRPISHCDGLRLSSSYLEG
jgi:hypothetical protein